MTRPVHLDFGILQLLGGMRGIDPRPAHAPTGGSNHAHFDSESRSFREGVFEQIAPLRSHHRGWADTDTATDVENVHAADALARHLRQVAGDSLAGDVPVNPPPPDAGS